MLEQKSEIRNTKSETVSNFVLRICLRFRAACFGFPAPQRGFTLLGVLVAAAMVAIVLGGVVIVAQRSGAASRQTKERLTATYLAREGIELVRAIRDNNWLAAGRCPNPGAAPPDNRICRLKWRGETAGPTALCEGTWRVDADTVVGTGLSGVGAGDTATVLFQDGTTYRHDSGRGSATPFRRWIVIDPSRSDRPDAGSPSPGACGEESVFVIQPPPPALPIPVSNARPEPFPVRVFVTWDPDPVGACAARRNCVAVAEELYPWQNVRQ